MFHFGIEHEVAFLNSEGKFADFQNTKYEDFCQIIDALPIYATDYPQLKVGDAGIRKKRWYIECLERFDEAGECVECVPKGIEIRTTIHASIEAAVNELTESFDLLREVAARFGFIPVLTSFNPYAEAYILQPPLNNFEKARLAEHPAEQTAHIHLVSYGPDLNISLENLPIDKLIDIGKKLTFYSPYIVPFTYSSPFYKGGLWEGLSVRTFIRTGQRAAALVFVENDVEIIRSAPEMTKKARIPAEIGRIEFKAFDGCDNFEIYAALLALLKGLILDQSLAGRAITPDANLHQISAKKGFESQEIAKIAVDILAAAEIALANDTDIRFLAPLKSILSERKSKAKELIYLFRDLGSIEETLKQTYLIVASPLTK